MPYIPISKATAHSKHVALDNGRVLSVINREDRENDRGYIALTLTDIDFKIIKEQYTWDEISISDFHIATYGYLPEALLSQVMAYFKAKTELKDKIKEAEEREADYELSNITYLYAKSKNRLNGIFGM